MLESLRQEIKQRTNLVLGLKIIVQYTTQYSASGEEMEYSVAGLESWYLYVLSSMLV